MPKNKKYDPLTYAGIADRIRDGLPLTPGQKAALRLTGLTVDDFRNQKTLEEKIAIVQFERTF